MGFLRTGGSRTIFSTCSTGVSGSSTGAGCEGGSSARLGAASAGASINWGEGLCLGRWGRSFVKDGEKGAAAAEPAGVGGVAAVASSGESQAAAAAAVASSSAAVEGGGSTSIGAAVGGADAVSGAAEAASTGGAGASPSQAESRGKAFIPLRAAGLP